jgi:hypothetical protein
LGLVERVVTAEANKSRQQTGAVIRRLVVSCLTSGTGCGVLFGGQREGDRMSQRNPTVHYLIVCEDVQTDPDNPRRVMLVRR